MRSSTRKSVQKRKTGLSCLGGDEYAILLVRSCKHNEVNRVLEKVLNAFKQPLQLGGVPINIDAAIGIALYPEHVDNPELLWQRADVALRAAKARNRGHQFYCPDIDRYNANQVLLLGELHDAIASDDLVLHYQPIVDLQTNETVAIEALVRWQHAHFGLIPPDRFIPLAERTKLIHSLTRWVFSHALHQDKVWQQGGITLDLSINLSVRNLHDPHIIQEILELVSASELSPSQLVVEITETAVMEDPILAGNTLTELHNAGIRISMDDFGTGQSSLTYLKDLPISKLKIDKSFVTHFDKPRNATIVQAAIDLAHNLGLHVTAEGVENESTYNALREMGCDLAQGYYIARPIPASNLDSWFRKSPWPPKRSLVAQ